MGADNRIVLVDDDAKVRELVAHRLRPPDFEVYAFSDGRDALMRIHEIRPDLIISDVLMPDMDGRDFFRVVKKSEQLKGVPFIFLSALRANDDIMAALDAGADAFLLKPFPISQLIEKVQARLAAAREARPRPEGAAESDLAHVQDEASRPPAAVGGIMADDGRAGPAGFFGEAASEQVFGMLLETEARATARLDVSVPSASDAGDDATETLSAGRGGSKSDPPGRFTVLEIDGTNVQVLTEGQSCPNFTITTTIARAGEGIRRIQTSWRHPLNRRDDRELAHRQLDRQHDQALASIRDFLSEGAPRRVLWGKQGRHIDGAVLSWTMSLVAAHVRAHLGPDATLSLVRRTHGRIAREHEELRSFFVTDDGRVTGPRTKEARVPQRAVEGVAMWASALLVEALGASSGTVALQIRHVTHAMAGELERIGFYSAVEECRRSYPRFTRAERSSSRRVAYS